MKNGILFVVGAVLISAALILTSRDVAQGQVGKGISGGAPHYTIVETQGHNLLVTDNKKNVVYFYTIDEKGKVGDDLKLRASCDLSQVGENIIKITKAAK